MLRRSSLRKTNEHHNRPESPCTPLVIKQLDFHFEIISARQRLQNFGDNGNTIGIRLLILWVGADRLGGIRSYDEMDQRQEIWWSYH